MKTYALILMSFSCLIIGLFGCAPQRRQAFVSEAAYRPYKTTAATALETPARDRFAMVAHNPWRVTSSPGNDASTFSTDVDTASYASLRAWIQSGQLPERAGIRIEEMVNYFSYDYQQPDTKTTHPIRLQGHLLPSPWNANNALLHVSLSTHTLAVQERPASNLVFLLDVSGSMQPHTKLGLIKRTFHHLLAHLDERDRVAIVVYAGASGLVLDSTPGSDQRRIIGALNRLSAGGATNASAGIQLAYDTAYRHFIPNGNNRVILATDGDFNLGLSDNSLLVPYVKQHSEKGVDLTILGVGQGNYMDYQLESISNNSNGNYFYIDTEKEAEKVFKTELTSNLITVARDVKAQLYFNPQHVKRWRQIGYANRQLLRQDFNDDAVDAGEIGAGHRVTALYELELGNTVNADRNPFLQHKPSDSSHAAIVRLRARYQAPLHMHSQLIEFDVTPATPTTHHSDDIQWAVLIASWGQLLRHNPNLSTYGWETLISAGQQYAGRDPFGYRAEAVQLMRQSAALHQAAAQGASDTGNNARLFNEKRWVQRR